MEYTAPSGAKVDITISDYSTSFDLMKSVLRAVRQGGISDKISGSFQGLDLEAIKTKDLGSLGGLFDLVVDVITSSEVENLIFKCMERCTYDDGKGIAKITRSTFEPESRRGDFIFVAFEVGRINIRPFLSQLDSGLKALFQGMSTSRPQK